MTVIGRATVADANAIARVHSVSATLAYADIFPATSPAPTADDLAPSWHEMLTDDACEVFVAAHDAEIIGVAAIRPGQQADGVAFNRQDADDRDSLFLARLYVHPDHWGHGHGAALHDQAVTAGFQRADHLYLWVLEHNESARRMYERRGWALIPGRFLENDPPTVLDVLYKLQSSGT